MPMNNPSVVSRAGIGIRVAADGTFALDDAIDSPLRIANCELWLDASNGAVDASWNACADGAAVSNVLDNSGNARHLAIASGTYQATGGYNSKPGILGKGVTPGFLASGWGAAYTLFIVSKASPSAGLRIKVGFGGAGYFGHNTTTAARDLSLNGLTPASSSISMPSGGGGGIDCIAVDVALQRILTGGTFGVTSSSSNSTMTRASTGNMTFSSTAVTVGGYAGSSAYDWGAWSEVILFSRYLTDSEVRRVWAYLAAKYETLPLLVTLGNSLVSGSYSTGGATQAPSVTGNNLPSRMLAELPGQIRVLVDAYPGRTGAQIFTESQAFSALLSAASPKTVSFVWEGTNTLATGGSVRKAYEEIVQVCKAKRASGKQVIVGTVLLRGDTGNDAKNAALTAQLNALILANYATFADRLCDLAADSRLTNFNNATYFGGDKTHLTDAGYVVCGQLLKLEVAALIA